MDGELRSHFRIDDELHLRAWTDADVETAYEIVIRNREHLRPFMHWMTPEYSLESARNFITQGIAATKEKKSHGLGIFDGDRCIGSIGFVYFDWASRKTEIGYWIDKDEEGKGIITRAAIVLIEYAFDELDLNRIEVRCAADNLKSAAVPVRLGFREEGELRSSEIRNGKTLDFKIFGLLADDPRVW